MKQSHVLVGALGLVTGFALGALALYLYANSQEEFTIVTPGSGVVIRVDEKTGKTHRLAGSQWVEVTEPATTSIALTSTPREERPAAVSPRVEAPVDLDSPGGITGRVTLLGRVPLSHAIQMGADPNCERMHSTSVNTEFAIVGEGGGLANTFVYIKSGLEGRSFYRPIEPVVLDQRGCVYVPHVVGIRVGQTLQIVNSDDLLHNIHAMPRYNKEFNIGQPVRGLVTDKMFDNVEVMVPIKCDVHKWMSAYVGVVDHPYFAVTNPDGKFFIPNLPPGTYVLEAWHERFGTKEMSVTVVASAIADAVYSFVVQ